MRQIWFSLLVMFAVAVGVCANAAVARSMEPPPGAAGERSAAEIPAYRLGPGDKIRMITFDEASLTGEFDVSGSGTVALPLIGEVKAAGLTTTEFAAAVETALKDGYLKNPQVSVEILNYRPFYILGEVSKPGEYPYTNGLTVLNAVATANGFTYRADMKHVYIRRANDTIEHKYDLTSNTAVAPGDTIRIGERYF